MSCTLCNKSASKLLTRSLCDCCMEHIKCCDVATKKFVPIVWEEDAFRKVECDLCSEEYQEGELQQHRVVCVPRVVFRCSLCDEDYLSQEGLWSHLVGHQIACEKRENYCQERKLTYKQYICILCNDQRSYRESCYWQHIHEDHDGFYLQCSKCRKTFRSKKHKNEHDLKDCKSKEQTPLKSDELEKLDDGKKNSQANQQPLQDSDSDVEIILDSNIIEKEADVQKSEQSNPTCPQCDKEFPHTRSLARHIKTSHRPAECDICRVTFETGNQATYHKMRYHAKKNHQCPQCLMKFRSEDSLGRHMLGFHHRRDNETDDSSKVKKQAPYTVAVMWNAKTDCPICLEKFSNQNQVSQHVEEIHKRKFCTICRMTFFNEDKLKEHSCSLCPHCNKGCYSRARLLSHIDICHEEVKCSVCNISICGKRRMWYHKMVAHSEPKLKCSKCPQKFHHKSERERHLAWCVKNECKCKLCGRKFDSPTLVDTHMKEVHGSPKSPADPAKSSDEKPHVESEPGTDDDKEKQDAVEPNNSKSRVRTLKDKHKKEKLTSPVLRFPGRNMSRLQNPNRKHSFHRDLSRKDMDQTSSGIDKFSSRKTGNLTSTQAIKQEPVLNIQNSADVRGLTHKQSLIASEETVELKMEISVEETQLQHSENQTTEQFDAQPTAPVFKKCPQCDKTIKVTSLPRHIQEVHSPCKCMVCGVDFESVRRRDYHVLIRHTKPKHKCPYCLESFHVKSAYQRHVFRHKGRYPCELCNLSFKSTLHLRLHVKKAHHADEGEPETPES